MTKSKQPCFMVGCERSGIVREALVRHGASAISVDKAACERPDGLGFHMQADLLSAFYAQRIALGDGWTGDALIAHPECTYLSSSGLHWNKRRPERAANTEEALAFVEQILRAPFYRVCLENPRGCITTRLAHVIAQLGYVRQSVQPYEFGDDASKETILLLKNLPLLVKQAKNRVPGRIVEWPLGSGRFVERWSNQTDSGQNRLGPSATRSMDRARTYPGIAEAMASQWVPFVLQSREEVDAAHALRELGEDE